jgi:hypothetical protein
MKIMRFFLIVAALLLCVPAFAEIKPCEELKNEIDAKLKEKNVANYSLEVVPADQVKDQKVVGSCDGGKNKIIYTKDNDKGKKEK